MSALSDITHMGMVNSYPFHETIFRKISLPALEGLELALCAVRIRSLEECVRRHGRSLRVLHWRDVSDA